MPAATTTQFAKLLRDIRKRVGLSQLQLAGYLGVSKSRVSKWETGVSDPPQDPQVYNRLLAVLGFTESDFTLVQLWSGEDSAFFDNQFAMEVMECLLEMDTDLPDAIQPIGQALTGISTKIRTPTIEEEAQEPSPESLPDTGDRGIIPSPMSPKPEVESDDHLTNHVNNLQSQAKFGAETNQRPIPYPHENVVFHVAQLRQEALEKQAPPAGSGVINGHLMTLAEASQTSGIPVGTLRNYLHEGKLTARGREFASAPGGGKVLVDAEDVRSLPRRLVGRPKKNPTTAVTNPS
jgi:transcriptional regulator with XRE-family HTH domain